MRLPPELKRYARLLSRLSRYKRPLKGYLSKLRAKMPPRGWKYSIVDQCYVPPSYWKDMRKNLEKMFRQKRLSNVLQTGAGYPDKKKYKKQSKGVEKKKFIKDTQPVQRDPMYTEEFTHYDPSCGIPFKQCTSWLT